MASLRSAEATKQRGKKRKILASYCTRSVVAVWSCEIQILTVCHRILTYLLWYLTVVSVGCTGVRSYVCADLLSIRKGSPSKGGSMEPVDLPLILLSNQIEQGSRARRSEKPGTRNLERGLLLEPRRERLKFTNRAV